MGPKGITIGAVALSTTRGITIKAITLSIIRGNITTSLIIFIIARVNIVIIIIIEVEVVFIIIIIGVGVVFIIINALYIASINFLVDYTLGLLFLRLSRSPSSSRNLLISSP